LKKNNPEKVQGANERARAKTPEKRYDCPLCS